MTRAIALIALIALAGCKAAVGRWDGDKVATSLTIDGITLPIPAGWRSLAELATGGDMTRYKPGPGTVGMMPEADRDGVVTATVVVTSTPRAGVPAWSTCAEALANAKSGPPTSDLHDGGTACRWHVALDRVTGTVAVRFVGEHELAAECLVDAKGDRDADATCTSVLHALQMP